MRNLKVGDKVQAPENCEICDYLTNGKVYEIVGHSKMGTPIIISDGGAELIITTKSCGSAHLCFNQWIIL